MPYYFEKLLTEFEQMFFGPPHSVYIALKEFHVCNAKCQLRSRIHMCVLQRNLTHQPKSIFKYVRNTRNSINYRITSAKESKLISTAIAKFMLSKNMVIIQFAEFLESFIFLAQLLTGFLNLVHTILPLDTLLVNSLFDT